MSQRKKDEPLGVGTARRTPPDERSGARAVSRVQPTRYLAAGIALSAAAWSTLLARSPRRRAADVWATTTHPGMPTDGFNWTQLAMSRDGNFPRSGPEKAPSPKSYHARDISDDLQGAMRLWHATYARSIPAVVHGLGDALAARFEGWSADDYVREWGDVNVLAAYAPEVTYQRGRQVADEPGAPRRLAMPHREWMRLGRFFEEQRAASRREPVVEHIALQQSPSKDFGEFGLPRLPPRLGPFVEPAMLQRNLWLAVPPKVSVLHYDWQDSVLLQLQGRKRFTLVDPARLPSVYPCVQQVEQLRRTAAGVFERILGDREVDNFCLVNVTHPDLARHPRFADARVMTVDVPAGSALLLPAYWYHQVESYADGEGEPNLAVNYWFQGHSLTTRLYRTLRENLFINCTRAAELGDDVCRDSVGGAARSEVPRTPEARGS